MTYAWTERRLIAALQAVRAMQAGEEGEGDAEGITFDELRGAEKRLQQELNRLRGRKL